MKRNTALFGASLVAGLAAASGLIATSTSSSAAGSTLYGVAWADGTSGQSSGWTTGSYADPYGVEFAGSASAGSGSFKLDAGGSTVSVTTTCVAGKPSVTVSGGGAAGTYTGGSTTLAKFTGLSTAQGSVTFATQTVGGHAVGAYINLAPGLAGTWVALTGADCAAAPTSSTTSSTTSSSTTPPPTSSSTTAPPTSTTTSTTPPPTTSSTTTPPPTTPPPTTEPPTPTPTTTTLPVTG